MFALAFLLQLLAFFFPLTFLIKFLLIVSSRVEIPTTLWANRIYSVLNTCSVKKTVLSDFQMSFNGFFVAFEVSFTVTFYS